MVPLPCRCVLLVCDPVFHVPGFLLSGGVEPAECCGDDWKLPGEYGTDGFGYVAVFALGVLVGADLQVVYPASD